MTDNQQRARSLLAFPAERGDITRVAAALDEAEARGRAEVAAKVEEVLAVMDRHGVVPGYVRALRALVADLVPGAQTDGEAGR